VEGTPGDHPDLAGRLNNLGNMIEIRFEKTRRMEDLEDSAAGSRYYACRLSTFSSHAEQLVQQT
jgi:hypothetical protein